MFEKLNKILNAVQGDYQPDFVHKDDLNFGYELFCAEDRGNNLLPCNTLNVLMRFAKDLDRVPVGRIVALENRRTGYITKVLRTSEGFETVEQINPNKEVIRDFE